MRTVAILFALPALAAALAFTSQAHAVCQPHQNLPIETGFRYNYYYGSTHSHSNYTDGGHALTACGSGSGTGNADPAAVFDFVKNTAGLDYWVVSDHNHLFDDAGAMSGDAVRARYQAGLAAARAATVDDRFVAVYGMEWGVTTNTDQGHVVLLETPKLFGWEPCVNCNGPTPECVGAACLFDVYTPKRGGYLALYARSVEHPSSEGALGIFAHPSSGNFDNFAFDANAEQAIQGIAVRSGGAFTTATDCAIGNVTATDYSARYRAALAKGFKVAPTADHDTHCNNYGIGLPTRTVYLLPNERTPVLTRQALLRAHKARRFFATDDANAQVAFTTTDRRRVMGEEFTANISVSMRIAIHDPDNEAVASLDVWRGRVGAAVPSAPMIRVSGQSALTFSDTQTSGTWYYWVRAVQADGNVIWSAPMWVTFGVTCDPATCDDGNACNGVERCVDGACVPGTPPNCDDGNACTADRCEPSVGCVQTPVADGTSCGDGNACNGQETCQAGTCTAGAPPACEDGNPCTAKSCDPVLGCVATPVADGTSCSDGNACNGEERCQVGACVAGTPPSCDDGNVCTSDTCDPDAGGCVNLPVVDGASCGDGNACNGEETCHAGTCLVGAPPKCDDGNACNGTESCDPALGCVAGQPLQCDGANPCLAYTCDASTGCASSPIAAGAQCEAGAGRCDGAGGCVPRVTLVSEGFQAGLGAWTEGGIGSKCWSAKAEAKADVPDSGADNLVGRATACTWGRILTLTRAVDTSALDEVTLSFWRFVDDLAAGDLFKVDVWDGAKWVNLTSWTDGAGDDSTWRKQSYDVTRYRNAAFKVRFYARVASANTALELDDLVVSGSPRP